MWKSTHPNDLIRDEKHKAVESLIFPTEKRDGAIKGHKCTNGSIQRSCIPKEEASYTTVTTESVLATIVTDAKQERGTMMMDIPNELT